MFTMNLIKLPLALSLGFVLLSGCSKKDDAPAAGGKGTANVTFENYAGSVPLKLQSNNSIEGYLYTNANGDPFSVHLYKYYISNIRFVKADGGEYAEPESYHLINQAEPTSFSFAIANMPEGKYTAVKLMLGVDSTRNVSGAQTGDLDPLKDMFWTWNSGYIMAKIEGQSSSSPKSDKSVVFHLGGFSGSYNVLHEVTLALPQALEIKNGGASSITFRSDILKWFEAPNMIDFALINNVMNPGKDAYNLSVNYSNMLSVTKVEN